MSTCYVITEGDSDVETLSILLGDLVREDAVKIAAAGGRSSAVSLARTLLATRRVPVALVVDADATDAGQVCELRAELENSLADVAQRDRFRVLLAVPSVEMLFFQDEPGLKNEFGDALTPELLVQSRYEPKRVIEQLLQAKNQPGDARARAFLLGQLNVQRLRDTPVVRELRQFLSAASQAAAA